MKKDQKSFYKGGCPNVLVSVAAFMRVAVMLCIVDMLVLVHFPVVIMRMDMLISSMATHRLSPP